MRLNIKKYGAEYAGIFLLSVFSGFLISFYSLAVLFVLALILFVIISFKYFNRVLFLLILYLPFQIALNISSGIDLASGRVLILYFFAVWIIKSLAGKRFAVRFNPQTLLLLLFLFIAGFSMLGAWNGERAIRKILVFLSIFPLYFIITSLSFPSLSKEGLGAVADKNKYIHKILCALFISGFILSLIGVVQFLLQFFVGIDPIMLFWREYIAPVFYGNTFGSRVISNPSWLVNISGATVLRAFSLFPDPHMFSFYLGFLIPIALAIVLRDKGDIKPPPDKGGRGGKFQNNKFLYLILAAMLLAELLAFSRGGYLGMISGIGAVVVLGWRYVSFYKKAVLGLVVAGMMVIFLLTANQSIVNRFLSSLDFNEGSNSERIKNWSQGWEMFNNNFLFGVGIGNYSYEIKPTADYRTPIYAHNVYLDIAAEMGVFALIVWLALILTTVYRLFKISRNTEDDFLRSVSLGLIGSFAWFSTHGFFDTPIYSPTILAMFMIIFSLSVMVSENIKLKLADENLTDT